MLARLIDRRSRLRVGGRLFKNRVCADRDGGRGRVENGDDVFHAGLLSTQRHLVSKRCPKRLELSVCAEDRFAYVVVGEFKCSW